MKNYANDIKDSPRVAFSRAEEAMGDLNNKRILHIGCGDGVFPRLLAQRGASVVGYDKAPGKIAEARAHEDARQLDATFVVATPVFARRNLPCSNVRSWCYISRYQPRSWQPFSAPHRATSAPGEDLSLSSSILCSGLLDGPSSCGGSPSWTATKRCLDRMSGRVEMAVDIYQYTCEEYERAALAGGMKPQLWKKLFATPDALQQMGISFWQPCQEHQPFALFVAQKE